MIVALAGVTGAIVGALVTGTLVGRYDTGGWPWSDPESY